MFCILSNVGVYRLYHVLLRIHSLPEWDILILGRQYYYYYILSCTVVLVLGCNWPYMAVVKHLNKLIELN
jgi:hypothetical protein